MLWFGDLNLVDLVQSVKVSTQQLVHGLCRNAGSTAVNPGGSSRFLWMLGEYCFDSKDLTPSLPHQGAPGSIPHTLSCQPTSYQ